MTTITEHLRARLLRETEEPTRSPSPQEIIAGVWDSIFEARMKNRMVLGYMRYGSERGERYDNVASMIKRLTMYRETGNQELLVDTANLAMIEYQYPGSHPAPSWCPLDDHNMRAPTVSNHKQESDDAHVRHKKK